MLLGRSMSSIPGQEVRKIERSGIILAVACFPLAVLVPCLEGTLEQCWGEGWVSVGTVPAYVWMIAFLPSAATMAHGVRLLITRAAGASRRTRLIGVASIAVALACLPVTWVAAVMLAIV